MTAAAIAAWVALASSAATLIVLVRRDFREAREARLRSQRDRLADDDKEADRLIDLKDQTIREYETRLSSVEDRVKVLEAKLDLHGCWNAPTCKTRRPLSGPADPAI